MQACETESPYNTHDSRSLTRFNLTVSALHVSLAMLDGDLWPLAETLLDPVGQSLMPRSDCACKSPTTLAI